MSAKQDLLKAAKTLGIDNVSNADGMNVIRAAINAKLGQPDLPNHDQEQQDEITDSYAAVINKHGEEAIARTTGAVLATRTNIPNLSPDGVWQGKRARIRRVKTGHNDMGGAIFKWNGWPAIIPLDQEVDIAWPIFGIIQACKGMRMEIAQEEDQRDKGRVQNIRNISYYDKYPYQFLGVTPGTEDLPESAWEYTLDQYVEGFPGYSVRMWRQLCVVWELSDEQCKIMAGIDPVQESKVRANAIHYHLNLPQTEDVALRKRVRNEKRQDIGMSTKAA